MIAGTLVLEDLTITFTTHQRDGGGGHTATYTVGDPITGMQATRTVPMKDFMAALSIAVHQDGEPDAARDYPAAESLQPEEFNLRWIP